MSTIAREKNTSNPLAGVVPATLVLADCVGAVSGSRERSGARQEAGSTALRGDAANLDLIRAVAVLCVLFHHLARLTGHGSDLTWLIGHMGVLIFFVHTSLVLMLSLDRNASRLEGAALAVDFYIRRLFRIYPLSIVVVTAAFLEVVPSRPEPWSWSTYLSNLTLTTNLTYSDEMWTVLWTLPLEVQMYAVLPVLFLVLRRRARSWAFAAWIVAVALAAIQPHVSGRLTVLAYAPCFVAGVIAWHFVRTERPRLAGAWWPLAFVASWSLFLIAPRKDPEIYRWVFCLALGCSIPWFSDLRSRFLVTPARVIAKYSYGIYLAHFPIIVFAISYDGVVRWVILAGLLVAVPVAMFHLIEQPMMDLGRRVAASLAALGSGLRHELHQRPVAEA